jgi:hypothetical protein
VSRKLSCRKYRGSFVAEWSKVVRIRKLVGGVDEARTGMTGGETEILINPASTSLHTLHTQEGVAVAFASCAFCVMDRKRNSSSNQGGFRHAPVSSQRPGRASRKAPGARVTPAEKGSRYMAQCTEQHGATLRSATSGVAGCCHPCLGVQ